MADWMDILLSPQYEQNGRFNALSIPQLIYGMTGAGRKEIDRKKGLRNRSQEASVTGQEAENAGTRARTGLTDSNTRALDQNTSVGGFNFDRARKAAGYQDAARLALPSPMSGIPGEISPEFMQMYEPQRQAQNVEEQYQQQKRLGGLGEAETTALAGRGVPITQPGQAEANRVASTGAHAQTLKSEEQRGRESNVATAVAHYMNYPTPEGFAMLKAMTEGYGVPVKFPTAQPSDAHGIDAEVMRRKTQPQAPQGQQYGPNPEPKPASFFGVPFRSSNNSARDLTPAAMKLLSNPAAAARSAGESIAAPVRNAGNAIGDFINPARRSQPVQAPQAPQLPQLPPEAMSRSPMFDQQFNLDLETLRAIIEGAQQGGLR